MDTSYIEVEKLQGLYKAITMIIKENIEKIFL